MSTNKTQNYNLHSWVPEDDFIRSEFNDNFTGIDTALKTLSDGLAAEQNARTSAVAAEKTAREQAVSAETTARKQAVTAEQNARIAAINSLTTAKAELVVGSYTGDYAESRTISLGFTPKVVLLISQYGRMGYSLSNSRVAYGGLFFPGHPIKVESSGSVSDPAIGAEVVTGGFAVYSRGSSRTNQGNTTYYYVAVK